MKAMQNLPNKRKVQSIISKACQAGKKFAKKCNFDAALMLQTCDRGDWMWWFIIEAKLYTKELCVKFARFCADNAKQHATNAANAAADAADAANAGYAADYAAANAGYAGYAAAYDAECKKQADWLRANL